MKTLGKLALAAALATGLAAIAQAQISYTGGTLSEDFDIMGIAGTTTPIGWFAGTGTGAAVTATTVIAGMGSSTTGGNYNFGIAGINAVTDRALGSLASASLQRDSELHLINNTGSDILQFTISYDGEEWRNGGSTSVANTLTLQLSLTGLTGSWVDLGSAFNFTSPIFGGTAGALDGNAAGNRVAGIGGTFTPSTAITNGSTFFLRWADPDDGGSDNGIAIDNFSFIAVPNHPFTCSSVSGCCSAVSVSCAANPPNDSSILSKNPASPGAGFSVFLASLRMTERTPIVVATVR